MSRVLLFVAAVAIAIAAPSANAAMILVDFADSRVDTVPDSLGRYWNELGTTPSAAGVVIADMIDSNNAATGVSLNLLSGKLLGEINFTANGGPLESSALVDWDDAVINDCMYLGSTSSAAAEFRLEGLTANAAYDLALYGANRSGSDRGLQVTIGSETQTIAFNNVETPLEGLLTFSNVTADANGQIVFTVEKGSLLYSYISGMSITPVPEPATLGLVLVGGVAALIRRRR